MCLTVPQKVVEVQQGRVKMQDGRWVGTQMVGKVKVGEMLLVQANLAIEKVSKAQVRAMKQVMGEEN